MLERVNHPHIYVDHKQGYVTFNVYTKLLLATLITNKRFKFYSSTEYVLCYCCYG